MSCVPPLEIGMIWSGDMFSFVRRLPVNAQSIFCLLANNAKSTALMANGRSLSDLWRLFVTITLSILRNGCFQYNRFALDL